jgi:hypothetical protein
MDSSGSNAQSCSWRASGDVDGTILKRDSSSVQIPEIRSITYFDRNNDSHINRLDGLILSIDLSAMQPANHLRMLMVWIPSGDVVSFFEFDAEVSITQAEVKIGSLARDGGNVSLIFRESTMALGISELRVEVQNITGGSIQAASSWVSASNLSGASLVRTTAAIQMSELTSIRYVDSVGTGWINPGDRLVLSFAEPFNEESIYRVQIIRASDNATLDSVEFRILDASTVPNVITPLGSLSLVGNYYELVILTFGKFNGTKGLSEFRLFIDDKSLPAFSPSGRWVASNDSSGATMWPMPFDPNPTPQIISVIYVDLQNNGFIDPGDQLRISFSPASPSGHHYSVSMYYIANGGYIDKVDFVY